jgi:guanosine-3',5'-bis(diphosphate) 3'-pyrophosphohydrolase
MAAAADPGALLRALAFAADKHRRQRRKDAEASPYINHPIAVAAVLALEGGITDQDLLIAAVLHDTVEDTQTSFEELESEFGPVVRGLVAEVTDDKTLPAPERKALQIAHASTATPAAKQLKIADKICNIRDIAGHPPANWSRTRKEEYIVWTEGVVAGCRGVNPNLDSAYEVALQGARRALGVSSGT